MTRGLFRTRGKDDGNIVADDNLGRLFIGIIFFLRGEVLTRGRFVSFRGTGLGGTEGKGEPLISFRFLPITVGGSVSFDDEEPFSS